MKVLFVAQYGPRAASSRTRVFDFLPLLKARGLDIDLAVVTPDRHLASLSSASRVGRWFTYLRIFVRTFRIGFRVARTASRFDVIYIQKVLFPNPIPVFLRRYRRKVVFDFDDAIFTLESFGESWWAGLRRRRRERGTPRMLRSAGHAIVENPYTAAYAEAHCPTVSTITGPIDTDRYRAVCRAPRDEVVLGWIGSPTTTRYLDLIRSALSSVCRERSEVRVHLIGAGPVGLPEVPVVRKDWTLDSEVENLGLFDIGLMPLSDDVFTRGKGGYKLLQYMAMGLPVVASPVGINSDLVDPGVNGFLAETEGEWVEALVRLIGDPGLREKMGRVGREKMECRYSLREAADRLSQILRSAALPKA